MPSAKWYGHILRNQAARILSGQSLSARAARQVRDYSINSVQVAVITAEIRGIDSLQARCDSDTKRGKDRPL